MERNNYNRALFTFLNWRYEHPVRLAYMACVSLDIAKAVINDYYKDKK